MELLALEPIFFAGCFIETEHPSGTKRSTYNDPLWERGAMDYYSNDTKRFPQTYEEKLCGAGLWSITCPYHSDIDDAKVSTKSKLDYVEFIFYEG
jgi:hypothetical protein